jgi:hypothetical protein
VSARSVVTYSSGYAAHISVIAALFGSRDLVILDRSAHRSLYDGATPSRAAIKRFRHNDLDHFKRILHKTAGVERRDRPTPLSTRPTKCTVHVERQGHAHVRDADMHPGVGDHPG